MGWAGWIMDTTDRNVEKIAGMKLPRMYAQVCLAC